jgi:hypothetical protein
MPIVDEDSYQRGRAGIFGSTGGSYDHGSWLAGRQNRIDSTLKPLDWPTHQTAAGSSAGSSDGLGGLIIFGLAACVAITFINDHLDEFLVGFGGLLIVLIVYKITRVCDQSKWHCFCVVFFGLAITLAATYAVYYSNLPPKTLATYLLGMTASLSSGVRSDFIATGLIGFLCLFIAFFYAQRPVDLFILPLIVLSFTMIAVVLIAIYDPFQSSNAAALGNKYAAAPTAERPTSKSPPSAAPIVQRAIVLGAHQRSPN